MDKKELRDLLLRYLVILCVGFALPLFSRILTPLTVYPVMAVLSLWGEVVKIGSQTVLYGSSALAVEIIDACVATSAYYLLFLLLFATKGGSWKRRLQAFGVAGVMFWAINVLRIAGLVLIAEKNLSWFFTAHYILWWGVSILVIVGLWIYVTGIYRLYGIPFVQDVRDLIQEIRQ